MKGIKQNPVWKALWILLAIAGGLVFFWLFPLKLVSRLAARLGHSSPWPAALSWLVDNSLRRTYMRPVLDRIGIRPGERALELGPGPGAFTVGAAERVGPEGRLSSGDAPSAAAGGPGRDFRQVCARRGPVDPAAARCTASRIRSARCARSAAR